MAEDSSFDPFGAFLASTPTYTIRSAKTPITRLRSLCDDGSLDERTAFDVRGSKLGHHVDEGDRCIENCFAVASVPMGVATDFVINGEPRHVVMATEERTVIAAASHGAKLTEEGFTAEADFHGENVLAAHALFDIPFHAVHRERLDTLLVQIHNELLRDDALRSRGTVVTSLKAHPVQKRTADTMLALNATVVECEVRCTDVMGANVVTEIMERIADAMAHLLGRRLAAIVRNVGSGILVQASARWTPNKVDVATLSRIRALYAWAEVDLDRTFTHNKGVMNGISAVALATGQDTRAIEAACHSALIRDCDRRSITSYTLRPDSTLEGTLRFRLPVAIKGGATGLSYAAMARGIMKVRSAGDLACIMASVGLANNFAALRCLAEEGIAKAHRRR